MTRQMTKWMALLCAATFLAGSANASVDAHLDRASVRLGEVFTLTLSARDQAMFEEPDVSVLQTDFEVLGLSEGQRTTIINGQRDTSRSWQIALAPRRLGRLEVPAVRLGAEASDPLSVLVTDARAVAGHPAGNSQAQAASPALVFEAQVDEAVPYVQEQVVLTLRLESDGSLLEGSMEDPVVQGAIVERLGDDRSDVVEVDGLPRQVVERRYAVFPQESGPLRIEPVVFEGLIRGSARPSRPARRSPFGSFFDDAFDDPFFDDFFSGSSGFFGSRSGLLNQAFGRGGQPVRLSSNAIQLDVQSRPAEAADVRWLPARSVQLVEIWDEGSRQAPTLRVGEPVNRLIAVHAQGATSAQLPVPELGEVEGARQYTEPSYDERQEISGNSVAIRALPTVLIPTRPGKLELPPIELAWWDTEANEARVASLPARTVEVQAAPGFAAAPPAAVEPPAPGSEAGSTAGAVAEPGQPGARPAWLVGLVGLVGALLILGAVGRMVWARRRVRSGASRSGAAVGAGTPPPAPALRVQERALKQACRGNDAAAAESALCGIARARWPGEGVNSPAQLGRRLRDEVLEREIRLLLSRRYAAQSDEWQGEALWQRYRVACRGARKDSQAAAGPGLPVLYPGLRGAS